MDARAWALLGGLLSLARLSIYSYWMNSYWGGAVAAIGGCLVMGAYPRIVRRGRFGYAWAMGLGLLILANTRPLEGAVTSLPIGVALLHWIWKGQKGDLRGRIVRVACPLGFCIAVTVAFTGYYNHRVTGNSLRLPHAEFARQYAHVPMLLGGKLDDRKVAYFNSDMEYQYAVWERAAVTEAKRGIFPLSCFSSRIRRPRNAGCPLGDPLVHDRLDEARPAHSADADLPGFDGAAAAGRGRRFTALRRPSDRVIFRIGRAMFSPSARRRARAPHRAGRFLSRAPRCQRDLLHRIRDLPRHVRPAGRRFSHRSSSGLKPRQRSSRPAKEKRSFSCGITSIPTCCSHLKIGTTTRRIWTRPRCCGFMTWDVARDDKFLPPIQDACHGSSLQTIRTASSPEWNFPRTIRRAPIESTPESYVLELLFHRFETPNRSSRIGDHHYSPADRGAGRNRAPY